MYFPTTLHSPIVTFQENHVEIRCRDIVPGVQRAERVIAAVSLRERVGRAALLLLAATLLPVPAVGQQGPPQQEESGASSPFLSFDVQRTSIRDRTRYMVGGAAGFEFPIGTSGHRFSIGGSAFVLGNDVTIPLGGQGLDLELGLGYGGIVVDYILPIPGTRIEASAGTLFGAGNADLRNPVSGLQADSDNLFVVEPHLSLRHPLAGPLWLSVTGGYRWTDGLSLSSGIDADDLKGATVAIGLNARFR